MNRSQLSQLPVVVDVSTAADALGLSRNAAYELIRVGRFPTPVFRLGRLIRVPTAPMLALLGVEPTRPAARARSTKPARTARPSP